MLKNVFRDPNLDTELNAGFALSDIAYLAQMWVFGSTAPEWTKERIGQEIDFNVTNLKSLDNWQPWQ